MASLEHGKRVGSNGYANALLTIVAVALVAVAMQLSGGSPAHAQQSSRRAAESGDPLGIPNAFAQRERQIRILESMEQRLRSLETKLGGGGPLEVRVVNIEEITTASVEVGHGEE